MNPATALPPGTECLAPFSASGVLDPVDVHLAAAIARLSGDDRPGVVLGAALASRAPRLGHVCLDLDRAAVTVVAGDGTSATLPWPDPAGWHEQLATSPAVAHASTLHASRRDPRPLVLDGRRLYLERTWREERTVAAHLLALAARPASSAVGSVVGSVVDSVGDDRDALLDAWFPAPADGGPDRQREAAAAMLTRGLTVVAGGPGTGKTRTLARVLALLHDPTRPPVKVALAAPTGKAAARMGQAVAAQLADAGVDGQRASGILDAARPVTLHRLLGLGPARRRPRRVDADLVIVDEASMISLSLMAELVRALPAHGRLVLVGDPHQLTSVEAGTVLADVVHAATVGGPLRDCVVTLERPFRFGAGSSIARLADAVREGDAAAVRATLDAATEGIGLVEHPDPIAAPDAGGVRELVLPTTRATWAAAAAGDAEGALRGLATTRLLCAHRSGHHGVEAWNHEVERWLRDAEPGFDPRARWHVGRPVLVTRNDPITGLANGDVGVVVRGAGDAGVQVAVERHGVVALLRPVQLPDVETFHAMTIHKSQGSEFDRVVVLLPPADSPLATRELLYTALTRGRSEVVLVGTRAALDAAVGRVVTRASGLADLLAHP